MRSADECPGTRSQAKSVDYAAVRSGASARLRITADTASSAICTIIPNTKRPLEVFRSMPNVVMTIWTPRSSKFFAVFRSGILLPHGTFE